ncbi:MAG: hypothetical protein AAF968_04195 [Pseudomonadota bacterium]
MPANLTFEELRDEVAEGKIDTVLICIVDMQGRLMGKRFHAVYFLESSYDETHDCDYLLATDLEMTPVLGYSSASWEKGCVPMMASELEFILFEQGFDALRDSRYAGLQPLGRFNADYAIHLTSQEEVVMRAIRNGPYGAGIPVENSKDEAEAGQEELNICYSDALDTANMHAICKTVGKEIAHQNGRSVTFMAKHEDGRAGSSSHLHQSLLKDGVPVFYDPAVEHGMSATMRACMARLLAHAEASTALLAPYVNNYKRFCEGLFAPTRAAMGDYVIDHDVDVARWEVEAANRAVTDWHVMRRFERT